MLEPKLPAREAERIASLRRLRQLDTAPEERFDRLTRIAALVVGVPIAMVSLVDADRQWFKSRIGMAASQTPRSVSFCGHAIAAGGPFVVSDAGADARFADNPLVTGEPGIRFYAGFPLDDGNGHKLGTLCVADRRARSLSAEQVAILTELAALAELELRSEGLERLMLQRRQATQRLDAVTEALGDALVAVDRSGRVTLFNAAAERMFGRSRAEVLQQDLALLLPDVDPGDPAGYLRRASTARDGTARASTVGDGEPLGQRADGTVFPVELSVSRAAVDGAPLYVTLLRDATTQRGADQDQRQLRREHRFLTEQAPIGIFLTDAEGRYVEVNRRWCELSGLAAEAALGAGWVAALHHDDTQRVVAAWSTQWSTAEHREHPFEIEFRFHSASGRVSWVRLRAVARHNDAGTFTGCLGFVRDVTVLRDAELALRTSEEIHRAVVDAVGEGIVVYDRTAQVVGCNAAAERMLGLPVDRILEWAAPDRGWPAVRADGTPFPVEEHPATRTLTTGQPSADVIMGFSAGDGRRRWISVCTQPMVGAGQLLPWGVSCALTDVADPAVPVVEAAPVVDQRRSES